MAVTLANAAALVMMVVRSKSRSRRQRRKTFAEALVAGFSVSPNGRAILVLVNLDTFNSHDRHQSE
jgi:hypothetical protein